MNASNNQSESDAEEAVSSPSIGESPMVTNRDTNVDKAPDEDDSTATSSACKETSAWNLLPRNFSSWQFFEVIN